MQADPRKVIFSRGKGIKRLMLMPDKGDVERIGHISLRKAMDNICENRLRGKSKF